MFGGVLANEMRPNHSHHFDRYGNAPTEEAILPSEMRNSSSGMICVNACDGVRLSVDSK